MPVTKRYARGLIRFLGNTPTRISNVHLIGGGLNSSRVSLKVSLCSRLAILTRSMIIVERYFRKRTRVKALKMNKNQLLRSVVCLLAAVFFSSLKRSYLIKSFQKKNTSLNRFKSQSALMKRTKLLFFKRYPFNVINLFGYLIFDILDFFTWKRFKVFSTHS